MSTHILRPTRSTTKCCTKCGEVKSLDQFARFARSRDGHMTQCKACNNARRKAWRQANPEREAATKRAWNKVNPERKAAYNKAYRERRARKQARREGVVS